MTQKYGEKSKLCYMDTDFLVYKKQTTFKQTFQKIFSKLIFTSQRFRCEKHNMFIEEFNKITMGSDNDKRIQSLSSIDMHLEQAKI